MLPFFIYISILAYSQKVNNFTPQNILSVRRFLTLVLFSFLSFGFHSLMAKNDTIIFKNGEYLVGEIKSMDKGVAIIETDYSDDDFNVEWDKIQQIYTLHKFLISLTSGERYNGSLRGTHPDSVRIYTFEYGTVVTKLESIVFLREVDESFKDRLYYSIDLGLSLTRANNLKQFTSRSSIRYTATKWTFGGSINSLVSDQDGQDQKTERTDANITLRYIMKKGWFFFPEVTFLSNTEQQLSLRTATKVGAGKYLFRTNKLYWALMGGVSFTNENFSGDDPTRNSREAFFGTDLNLFDIGDFNFLTQGTIYPSFTESGRYRVDLTFDIKYDLPFDFYIKLGTTLNYDNQPIEAGTESDYVIQSSIGWEFD